MFVGVEKEIKIKTMLTSNICFKSILVFKTFQIIEREKKNASI